MKKNFLKLFVQIIDITYSQWSEFKKVYKSTNQIIDIQSINKNKKNMLKLIIQIIDIQSMNLKKGLKMVCSNDWYSGNELLYKLLIFNQWIWSDRYCT